jgi:hypothetical protein
MQRFKFDHAKVKGPFRFEIRALASKIVDAYGVHFDTTGGAMRFREFGITPDRLIIASDLYCAVESIGVWFTGVHNGITAPYKVVSEGNIIAGEVDISNITDEMIPDVKDDGREDSV